MLVLLGTWIEDENQYSFGKLLSHPWPCTSHLGSILFTLTTVNLSPMFTWGGRVVARNEHLGGSGCNKNILNIILKSIGYKIINFHISSYIWTCWEFNRNSKHVRNKKIEKKNAKRKTITLTRQYLRGSAICLRPQSCRDFTIIKENYKVRLQCFSFSKTTRRQNPNHKKKMAFISSAQDS